MHNSAVLRGREVFDLKDKRILVAGYAGLIGCRICDKLTEMGADLYCATWDLSIPDYGFLKSKPEVFINCTYPKEYHKHLDAFLWNTQKIAQWMSAHGGGSIINFASIYGMVAYDVRSYEGTEMFDPDEWVSYSAVKGGIIAMTRALAAEYAPFGVRINCISPGGVYDDQPKAFVQDYCKRVPAGRMANPSDLVGPVAFLASEASAYVTGVNLVVDGGLTCW